MKLNIIKVEKETEDLIVKLATIRTEDLIVKEVIEEHVDTLK